MSNIYHEEPVQLWLHIMGGILGAVAVLALIWYLHGSYQEYKAEQAILKIQQQAREERARAHQRRVELERMKIQERQRVERKRELNSPECQFWTNHYHKNMTQANLLKVNKYCP